MKRTEQIDRHMRSGEHKRSAKRRVCRARRRAEKVDPENAPRQVREFLRGYTL